MPSSISSSLSTTVSGPNQQDVAVVNLQTAASGTGNGTAMTLDGKSQQVTVSVPAGTYTVIFEHSIDAGVSWLSAFLQDINTAAAVIAAPIGAIVSPAGTSLYIYRPIPGVTRLRARISVYVAGTPTITAIERRLA